MDREQELRDRYNPDGSSLRKAQLRMLDMLVFIDKVCKENDICYWLDSGTLLGAARHQGFIPWDDDTDICMPREDMLRFKKVLIEKYPHHQYVIQCPETDRYYLVPWIVLRDTKSEYIQDSNLHRARKYRGLQVDIFPLDVRHTKVFHRLCAGYQSFLVTKLLQKSSQIWHQVAYVAYHTFDKIVVPVLRLLSPKHTFYRMCYGIPFTSQRRLDDIYPLSTISFEGHAFASPGNTDAYLKGIYGDWRKIPSSDKIKTHEVKCVFYD